MPNAGPVCLKHFLCKSDKNTFGKDKASDLSNAEKLVAEGRSCDRHWAVEIQHVLGSPVPFKAVCLLGQYASRGDEQANRRMTPPSDI